MTIYHVTFEATGEGQSPETHDLDRFLDVLGADATVLGVPETGSPGYGAQITATADSALSAIEAASEVFAKAVRKAKLPRWPIVRISVLSDAELDAELSRPNLELVGIREIADLLGVTPQRASTLCRSSSFPQPVAELRAGPVWTAPSVRRFVEEWRRQPGRPRLKKASA